LFIFFTLFFPYDIPKKKKLKKMMWGHSEKWTSHKNKCCIFLTFLWTFRFVELSPYNLTCWTWAPPNYTKNFLDGFYARPITLRILYIKATVCVCLCGQCLEDSFSHCLFLWSVLGVGEGRAQWSMGRGG
jgi:hypothetical protein